MELNGSYLSFIFVWTVLIVDHVQGYSSGIPNDMSACNTLLPTHSTAVQPTEIPYTVTVDGIANSEDYDVTHNHTGNFKLTPTRSKRSHMSGVQRSDFLVLF